MLLHTLQPAPGQTFSPQEVPPPSSIDSLSNSSQAQSTTMTSAKHRHVCARLAAAHPHQPMSRARHRHRRSTPDPKPVAPVDAIVAGTTREPKPAHLFAIHPSRSSHAAFAVSTEDCGDVVVNGVALLQMLDVAHGEGERFGPSFTDEHEKTRKSLAAEARRPSSVGNNSSADSEGNMTSGVDTQMSSDTLSDATCRRRQRECTLSTQVLTPGHRSRLR